MKPLNYAILKYFTKVDKASAKDVVEALKPEYGSFRALNEKAKLTEEDFVPKIWIDAAMPFEYITEPLIRELERRMSESYGGQKDQ